MKFQGKLTRTQNIEANYTKYFGAKQPENESEEKPYVNYFIEH